MDDEEEMKLEKRAYASTLFAAHWSWRFYRYVLGYLPWMAWVVIALFPGFLQAWRKWNMDHVLSVASIPFLVVFAPLFYIFNFLDKSIRLPAMIQRNDQLERAASLLVFCLCFLVMKHGMSYYYGEDSPVMVGEQDGGEYGEQEVVVEPELRTLFRDL